MLAGDNCVWGGGATLMSCIIPSQGCLIFWGQETSARAQLGHGQLAHQRQRWAGPAPIGSSGLIPGAQVGLR